MSPSHRLRPGRAVPGAALWMAAGLAALAPPALAPPASAQEAPRPGRALRIDVEPLYAAGSLVYPAGSGWRIGGGAGLGLQAAQVTLVPGDGGFTGLAHLALVAERSLDERWSLDLGMRLGGADLLRSCGASDCLPQGYVAGVVTLDAGGDRWRAATRLLVGRQDGETVVAWTPLHLRLRFRRRGRPRRGAARAPAREPQ